MPRSPNGQTSSRPTTFRRSTDEQTGFVMNEMSKPAAAIKSEDHWTTKDGGVKLFLFEKYAGDPVKTVGTVLFVHGSSMASQPTFDLQVLGRADSSAMDHFARRGYDCWCVDMEGYGRSTKDRDNNAPISQGADDCYAAALYIQKLRGKRPFLVYGISSGALRAAMFAERHPEMVARLALDAMVWTGEGSPTLEQRRKKLPEFQAKNRRALDNSVPTGTYVDMCSKLPVVNPEKITVPTLIMRGQHDGIASMEDLLKFYAKLANPDKQFTVMPGISHASFQQKNYMLVYHILASFFAQPAPL